MYLEDIKKMIDDLNDPTRYDERIRMLTPEQKKMLGEMLELDWEHIDEGK